MADIKRCALCNESTDHYLTFVGHSVVGIKCSMLYGLAQNGKFTEIAKKYAHWHTVGQLKHMLEEFGEFNVKQAQMENNEAIDSDLGRKTVYLRTEHEQFINATDDYDHILTDFKKNESGTFSHFIFSNKKKQILEKKDLLRDPRVINYSDIISYRVNQQGHDERKHHGITRAIIGGALAGGGGAVVGAATGHKQTDYIDHLGLVVNLKDGSNFELVFIRKIDQVKANSWSARSSFKQMNDYISIFDSIIAQNKQADSSITSTNQIDPADEIRKFKKLADDGIITQEEFEQKKKQLLEL